MYSAVSTVHRTATRIGGAPETITDPSALQDGWETIILPGLNCWRSGQVEKGAFLVDADSYFSQLSTVLQSARKRIWIVGWNFDPRIKLQPREMDSPQLGPLLRSLVEKHPDLEIRILDWAVGVIYSSRSVKLLLHHEWADHPRIHLKFDSRHPIRGSHHQKIVCVDDAIGFIGGIDLTSGRWDDSSHAAESELRRNPNGDAYGPVHDVHCMVSGKAARDLGALAARRWKMFTGDGIAPLQRPPRLWPKNRTPDFSDCRFAIALTEPRIRGQKGRKDAVKLTLDAIAAARKHIYIETQYLASFNVGRALSKRLKEEDGPEIIIVTTKHSRGLLEQFVMATNRNRLIRRLKAADRNGRLRVMYAAVPASDGSEAELLVHSKVIVIDDRFARVGSSNLNYRSEGLDTEADLAIEASNADCRRAIAAFRNGLLAEHIACDAELFGETIRSTGSMIAAIDRLNTQRRGLRAYGIRATNKETESLWGTSLLDPIKPYWPLQKLRSAAARLFGGLF